MKTSIISIVGVAYIFIITCIVSGRSTSTSTSTSTAETECYHGDSYIESLKLVEYEALPVLISDKSAGYRLILVISPAPLYRVSLSSQEQCDSSSSSSSQLIAIFDVDNRHNTECRKVLLDFPVYFIISGCYTINVTPFRNASSGRSEIYTVEIKNDHTAADFHIDRPEFKVTNEEEYAELLWGFRNTVFVEENIKYVVELTINHSKTDITENCHKKNDAIICKCANLTVGNYSTEFKLLDFWRCSIHHGIFGEACHWHQKFERILPVKSQGLHAQEKFPLSTFLHSLWIFAVLLGILVCVCLYIRRRINRANNINQKTIDEASDFIIPNNNMKNVIFLIYARDHELFMEAMVEFRTLLAKITGCKVIDVFDFDCFDQFVVSPQEYIQNLIDNKNTICIIVETECMDLILGTMRPEPNNTGDIKLNDIYKESHSMDHFILYSLKLILSDIFSPTYQKYFVLRLSGFNGCKYLKYLNPFTRYEIPVSLDILFDMLVDIVEQNNHIERPIDGRKLTNVSQSFVDKIDCFQKFALNYPDYLNFHILKDNMLKNQRSSAEL